MKKIIKKYIFHIFNSLAYLILKKAGHVAGSLYTIMNSSIVGKRPHGIPKTR